tara:strand:- start:1970 stop:2617 length:648 start_codon:yes stop_codon:yes gene_type:complete
MYYIVSRITNKKINNTIIILWDIHCKQNFLQYVNAITNYKIVQITEIGYIIQINNNYIAFMSQHPQEYTNINILFNKIKDVIQKNNISSIISFSTAGSNTYNIGSVLQFHSAIIVDPEKYDLSNNLIKSNNILFETSQFINSPIGNTKGFTRCPKELVACGQDEFVIYELSNQLNMPCLTLTGISDQNSIKQYDDDGGNLAAKNVVNYFFENYKL